MTGKQTFLQKLYPLVMKLTQLAGTNNTRLYNPANVMPSTPFGSLQAVQNNGDLFSFATLENRKVLLVNTASNCGYTAQYRQLQQLQELFPGLAVLGFPSNDFKEQEKDSDATIAAFCKVNYGVTFPLMQKSSVAKGERQHPVFRWLTDAGENGWNEQAPEWNFSKYLVNGKGQLMHYFGPAVSPMGKAFLQAVHQL